MKIFNFLALSAIALFAAVAPVQAQVSCNVELSIGAQISEVRSNGIALSDNGGVIAPGIGCDYAVQGFVIGVLTRYDFSDLASTGGMFTVASKLGYKINDQVTPYALVGISSSRFDFGLGKTKTEDAFMYGFGLQVGLFEGTALRVEYDRVDFDTKNFGSGLVSPTESIIRVGMTYDIYKGAF